MLSDFRPEMLSCAVSTIIVICVRFPESCICQLSSVKLSLPSCIECFLDILYIYLSLCQHRKLKVCDPAWTLAGQQAETLKEQCTTQAVYTH